MEKKGLVKYTHAEINKAAMTARKEMEMVLTADECKRRWPQHTVKRQVESFGSIDHDRYIKYDLAKLIEKFNEMLNKGADSVEFSWSIGDWADSDPLEMSFTKQQAETDVEYLGRLAQMKETVMLEAYSKKQNEMLSYNHKIEQYKQLQAELGL